jgi:multicomponent Na+:H+ antiporter subunit D
VFFEASFWLPLAIMAPLASALLLFLLPRYNSPITALGTAATLVVVAMAATLIVQNGVVRHLIGGWGAPLGIDLTADGLTALMLALTAVLGAAITLYAYGYFTHPTHDDAARARYVNFWPLWFFLWAALNALFLSGDLFNLYVTLELVSFAAVALTALAGKPAVLAAAMRYLLVSLIGSLFYLMGVVFLYGGFGVLDIEQLGAMVMVTPALAGAAALITVGLIMKTALFPLHFWLPPAHANATAPVSALLSALVIKGSFYILLRLWLGVLYPLGETVAPSLLMALGAAALLWGSLQAIRQTRLKLLVAYSTVAQIGYLFLLMPLLLAERNNQVALAGVVCFVLAHASAKASAFLSAGTIQLVTGDDSIASLRGLMQILPTPVAAFALAGISLAALPPSGGFVAKWFMLNATLASGYWAVALVIIAGGLLAAVYIMRVLAPLFRQVEALEKHCVARVPLSMNLSAFGLAVLAILLSFTGMYVFEILATSASWLTEAGL